MVRVNYVKVHGYLIFQSGHVGPQQPGPEDQRGAASGEVRPQPHLRRRREVAADRGVEAGTGNAREVPQLRHEHHTLSLLATGRILMSIRK